MSAQTQFPLATGHGRRYVQDRWDTFTMQLGLATNKDQRRKAMNRFFRWYWKAQPKLVEDLHADEVAESVFEAAAKALRAKHFKTPEIQEAWATFQDAA